jgi:hypothetical protein
MPVRMNPMIPRTIETRPMINDQVWPGVLGPGLLRYLIPNFSSGVKVATFLPFHWTLRYPAPTAPAVHTQLDKPSLMTAHAEPASLVGTAGRPRRVSNRPKPLRSRRCRAWTAWARPFMVSR